MHNYKTEFFHSKKITKYLARKWFDANLNFKKSFEKMILKSLASLHGGVILIPLLAIYILI